MRVNMTTRLPRMLACVATCALTGAGGLAQVAEMSGIVIMTVGMDEDLRSAHHMQPHRMLGSLGHAIQGIAAS